VPLPPPSRPFSGVRREQALVSGEAGRGVAAQLSLPCVTRSCHTAMCKLRFGRIQADKGPRVLV
jgi:hypothetical protein